MIPLTQNTINKQEINNLINWLSTYPKLTKGDLTVEFEKKWSEFMNVEYSIFVNSGSSANLLMVYYYLEAGLIKRNDSIIIPSLSWATTLSPVIQFGLNPILCDCNLNDLSVDIDHLVELIETKKPKAFILVPVLGFVPNMEAITEICNKYNVILLEDTCESLGSEYNGKKLGSFGEISTFSTYYGHHISTIEGGVICTNDKKIANILKSIRSHGWDRDMDSDFSKFYREKYSISDFESLYTFYHAGFNVRSTDLQAFLGLSQLERLPEIIKKRNENYNLYNGFLKSDLWKPERDGKKFVSNFAYPIISDNRSKIIKLLKDNNIEIRPLLSGSLSRHPYWYKNFGRVELKNCDFIHDNGMYVPNNHEISEDEILFICNLINDL